MTDNRIYTSPDAADLVESPAALAELSTYPTSVRCTIGEGILRALEKSGAPAPPRVRRWLDENGQSNRCRGRATTHTESRATAPARTSTTWTGSTVAEVGANPAARAAIRAMSPAARRHLAENVTAVFGRSASRPATEAAPAPVAQSAAALSRMAPAEARAALQREAGELRRTGIAGSDASALVMACEARPDIAADAGYTTDVVAGIIGQHLTPTPHTGQLGRRPA